MLIDTHCHLGGCISPEFVWKAIRQTAQTYLAESLAEVEHSMRFEAQELRSFDRFLNKFKILNELHWTPELIELAIADSINQIRHNQYTLLSMSIDKYMCIGWHKKECVRFIRQCFDKYAPGRVGLLLGLKYENTKTTIKQHASLIDDQEMYDAFAGIDLVGNERMLDLSALNSVLQDWQDKIVRLHIGEVGDSKSIDAVIGDRHVNRLAHAVSANRECRALIRQSGIAVDMCLSSNYFTGICDDFLSHPITKFLDEGVEVTIGSDDPVQFNTDLQKEYRIAAKIDANVDTLIQNSKRLLPNLAG